MKTVLNIKNLVGTIVIVSTSENKISEEIGAKVIKALLSALNQVHKPAARPFALLATQKSIAGERSAFENQKEFDWCSNFQPFLRSTHQAEMKNVFDLV